MIHILSQENAGLKAIPAPAGMPQRHIYPNYRLFSQFIPSPCLTL
jgi:hypothetical protein